MRIQPTDSRALSESVGQVLRETETRRWLLDAGMTRYYSLFDPTERDTYRYLQNTIKWLAK